MGNFNSKTTKFDLEITKIEREIRRAYRRHEKEILRMHLPINQVQAEVINRNQAQNLLTGLLDKTVPAVELARKRIAGLEEERFGDLDEYEWRRCWDSDPDSEGVKSTGWEGRSVFKGALAGMYPTSNGKRSGLSTVASTLLDGEQVHQYLDDLDLGLAPPREENLGQERRRRGSLAGPYLMFRRWILAELIVILLYFLAIWLL